MSCKLSEKPPFLRAKTSRPHSPPSVSDQPGRDRNRRLRHHPPGDRGRSRETPLQEITIPKVEWTNIINDAFKTIKINLNNYTPNQQSIVKNATYAFHYPNSSYIRISGMQLNFDIMPARQDPFTVYIENIKSSTIRVSNTNGKVELSIINEIAPAVTGSLLVFALSRGAKKVLGR